MKKEFASYSQSQRDKPKDSKSLHPKYASGLSKEGANLPQNVKGDKLPQIIQLVFGGSFFGYYGNVVLDSGFNSSAFLQDHIHRYNFFSNFSYSWIKLKKLHQRKFVASWSSLTASDNFTRVVYGKLLSCRGSYQFFPHNFFSKTLKKIDELWISRSVLNLHSKGLDQTFFCHSRNCSDVAQ